MQDLSTAYFINDLSGYITGNRIPPNGPNILRTSNGGLSWDVLPFSYGNVFSKLGFINFNTGYGSFGGLKKTTNAGANWLDLGLFFSVNDFSFFDNQNIFTCGSKGSLESSTNGGLNWSANSSGFYGSFLCIKFFDANTGIAAGGGRYGYTGTYLRTTNAGVNWDSSSIDLEPLENIYLLNQNTGYVTGYGKIFRTTNNGASFAAFPTRSPYPRCALCSPNASTGYCA